MNSLLVYCESLSACAAMLLLLFIYNIKKWKPKIINAMAMVYVCTITSAILDIIWQNIEGKSDLRNASIVINCFYFILMTLSAYFTFEACLDRLPIGNWKKWYIRLPLIIPIAAVAIISIISIQTGWLFYVSKEGVYTRGKIYILQPIISYLYVFSVMIIAIIFSKKAQLQSEKINCRVIATFPLIVILFGAIQVILPPGIPSIHFGNMIGLFILFMAENDTQITRDSLTRLFNRYAMDTIISEKLAKYKKEDNQHLFLLLGDLDDFKKINDTYGHMEGDRALQTTSDVLSALTSEYNAAAFRMGGDEFAVIFETERPDDILIFRERLMFLLAEASENDVYTLKMSMGFAEYDGELELVKFIDLADKNLYLIKKERKSNQINSAT